MQELFNDCGTINDLNKKRQEILQDINKQYTEAKNRILQTPATFKRIPIFRIAEAERVEKTLVAAYNISEQHAAPNELILLKDGRIAI